MLYLHHLTERFLCRHLGLPEPPALCLETNERITGKGRVVTATLRTSMGKRKDKDL